MFDKFLQNPFTEEIKEALMSKSESLKTFSCETSVISKDHEMFGLTKDFSDDEIVRKVNVSVLPLDWVYLRGGQLSILFREFRSYQDKYQGSLLLEVMFDAFWSDFKWKIFGFCFVPYLFYFASSCIYIMMMLYKPGEVSPSYDLNSSALDYLDTYEVPLRFVFFVLLLFHIGIQIKQLSNDGFMKHIGQI